MSHSIVAHVKHADHVAHDAPNGVAALTAKFVTELAEAGHHVERHHVHKHGHHVAHVLHEG